MTEVNDILIGVLALQGAFEEHNHILTQLGCRNIQVRNENDLQKIDGLIIPGGESTAMALIAERCGLWPFLVDFCKHKPVFGTCAGLILLAKTVDHQKLNGQKTLGCMDIVVDRNFFGSQIASFGMTMSAQFSITQKESFFAYFIRAPIIEKITSNDVYIISQLSKDVVESKKKFNGHELSNSEFIIAVQQKQWLGTSFHPELSNCTVFHAHFIEMVHTHANK